MGTLKLKQYSGRKLCMKLNKLSKYTTYFETDMNIVYALIHPSVCMVDFNGTEF